MKFPIALQTYTVREELARDFFGTLDQIARIGYTGVELTLPLPGVAVSQAKEHLSRNGLEWVSCHVNAELLSNRLEALIETLQAAGCCHLVLAYFSFGSKQEVLAAAERFNRAGAACRAQNIQFSYHNHDHEFQAFEGERALDLLSRETDPELVKFELDTYWTQRAGEDPSAYLSRLKDRCPLLHIKDMEAGPDGFFAEIGEGILDFEAIFRAAAGAGVQWLIVEQDGSRRSVFDSVAISYRNLLGLGVVA